MPISWYLPQDQTDPGLLSDVLPFWAPFWRLRGNIYNEHIRLIGKRVGDFLLVLTELFSLRFTAEALRAIICSKSAISL